MKNEDTRFIKLKEWHEKQSAHCYGLGGMGPEKDTSKDSPMYGCFYDKQEPEWMERINGYTRLRVYERIICDGTWLLSYQANFFRAKCIAYGGTLSILNIATFVWGALLPVPLEKLAYVGLTIVNIPATAYTTYLYCKGLYEEQRLEERIDYYKDKSMEFILREAHTKEFVKIESLHTPDPIEPSMEQRSL